MRTANIYIKPCPACGAAVAVEANGCDCGYVFESQGQITSDEQALQEEELFEAYLSARVDQAVAAVEHARSEWSADNSSRFKADKLVRVIQEALTLRDERIAQAEKITRLRQSLAAANPEAAMSAQPTEAFRAQQSLKADRIMEAFSDTQTKTCPHCRTVLPVISVLCLCGYIFARDDFMRPRAVDRAVPGEAPRAK